jgi:hypothetical protein
MTDSSSILIIDTDTISVTNRIYNDINFSAISYNLITKMLVAGDHGGYLMTMHFNTVFGDIEEEGYSYKDKNKISKEKNRLSNTDRKEFSSEIQNIEIDPPLNK